MKPKTNTLAVKLASIGTLRGDVHARSAADRTVAPLNVAQTAQRHVPAKFKRARREKVRAVLSPELFRKIDAWWRAANYLSVGQIYLFDNPLLKKPLKPAHIKPRLLGHWGTTPGLNFIYVHLNRAIKEQGLNVIYLTGPGHGGPGLVANAYLEGTYSEVYPNVG